MPATKKAQAKIYQLKVTINYIKPPVWRRLQVPGEITLGELHGILQTAFGWTESHLHQFIIGKRSYGVPDPGYGWGAPMKDEQGARLRNIVARGIRRFIYEYDFGDGWEHAIVVEKKFAPEPDAVYPRCLAGRRAGPPEDCGGPWGYAALLEAIQDPEHPEHAEMSEWAGDYFEPEVFDLESVNALLRPRPRSHR